MRETYTTAGGDGDLDRVPAGLADVLEVERLVGGFVLSSVNVQRSGVDRHLNTSRPVGVHRSVFVVETFELKFQVVPLIIRKPHRYTICFD